jgi:hypothetical protein
VDHRDKPGDDGWYVVTSHPSIFRARNFFSPPLLFARTEQQRLEMSENYIIEIGSQAAGIVVRNPDGYRFFAATHRFNPLEGQLFLNAREAERAVRRLANGELTIAA